MLTTPFSCLWGTSQIKEWLILLLHLGPELLYRGPSAWAWSLLVQLYGAAVSHLAQLAQAAGRVTWITEKGVFLAHGQPGRGGTATVQPPTDLAVQLNVLCKVGHIILMIADH